MSGANEKLQGPTLQLSSCLPILLAVGLEIETSFRLYMRICTVSKTSVPSVSENVHLDFPYWSLKTCKDRLQLVQAL